MDSRIGRSLGDRISNLPDHVLCYILSFMPTKYAVLTSVLSKRWQVLWTRVNTLDFDDALKFHDDSSVELDLLNFKDFVDRVMFLSDVSCWEMFSLRLQSYCDPAQIESWIDAAIKRNVRKMELHFGEYYKKNPFLLPNAIFTSETLVDLTLDGQVVLKLDASLWLPSIKILNLVDLLYGSKVLLQKLFSGCPILEDLRIYRCNSVKGIELNISVPTLRSLIVTRFGDRAHSFAKLVVNAPKLEHIHLSDYVTDEFVLENLSSLFRACIIIGGFYTRPLRLRPNGSTNYDAPISTLLMGIANVKFLDFFVGRRDFYLPTFANLTHLRLGGRHGGWNLYLLNEFLESSPNLQVLTLEENRVLSTGPWTPPRHVPCCLLSHLKEIRIMKFNGKGDDLEVAKYLLKNAQVLKKMTIDCEYSTRSDCGTLAELPRNSKTCQLIFLL